MEEDNFNLKLNTDYYNNSMEEDNSNLTSDIDYQYNIGEDISNLESSEDYQNLIEEDKKILSIIKIRHCDSIFLEHLKPIIESNDQTKLDTYINTNIIGGNYSVIFISSSIRMMYEKYHKLYYVNSYEKLNSFIEEDFLRHQICNDHVVDFAKFLGTYCLYFLNNSINKKSDKYKLAYYGLIKMIIEFNSKSEYILENVSSFNFQIITDNEKLENGLYFDGLCYYNSLFMYFHEQDFNPIKNLIRKDVKLITNLDIGADLDKLHLVPYCWISSIVFWHEFGFGYYCRANIFYNKFLNIFAWYGVFNDEEYQMKLENENEYENIKIKKMALTSSYHASLCTSHSFITEYKTDIDKKGLYIYIETPNDEFILNNTISVYIYYKNNNNAHVVVLDFYYKYDGITFGGCIYDSNRGIENFTCSFKHNLEEDYKKQHYLFIEETPIIKFNFSTLGEVTHISATNLFINYIGFYYDIYNQGSDDIIYSILDCNLNNKIITYEPRKYINDKTLIVSIKKLINNDIFLHTMKKQLLEAYENRFEINIYKSLNGRQKFKIIHDIRNYVSTLEYNPDNSTKIEDQIIERLNYFMNENKFYLNKSYLIINEIFNVKKIISYLYIDHGLFFKFEDIKKYVKHDTSIPPKHFIYYHLTKEFEFKPIKLYEYSFRPDPYFLQPIINYDNFFAKIKYEGGFLKNNLNYKFIIIIFIFIIFIIILIIGLIKKNNKIIIKKKNI